MTDASSELLWDGQSINLARHIVNLKESYSERVSAAVVSLFETGVVTERSRVLVHNKLHALVRTSPSFASLPTALKPYSFDNPAPGARFWRDAQTTYVDAITNESVRRTALGDKPPDMSIDVNISSHPDASSAILVNLICPDIFAAFETTLTDTEAKNGT
jgi:hypothetical protein|eukprot:614704-Prymnesium_polylepis.2